MIIFTDVDGVLCTLKSHTANRGKGMMDIWDITSCRLLKRLCEDYKCKIVISSSWRTCTPNMNEYLEKYELLQFLHEDWRTKRLVGIRGYEIEEWLLRHPEPYIIIDDDCDFLDNQMKYLIQPKSEDGLGFNEFIKADKILKDHNAI